MIEYLDLRGVAEHAGLTYNTVKSYLPKGLLPHHDATIGNRIGWLPDTVYLWIPDRPGRGWRKAGPHGAAERDREPIAYLDLRGVAEHAGLTYNTVKSYLPKGLLPHHDATIGNRIGWLPDSVALWLPARPGRGWRSRASNGDQTHHSGHLSQ